MFIIKETKIVKKTITVKKLTGIIFILLRMSENKCLLGFVRRFICVLNIKTLILGSNEKTEVLRARNGPVFVLQGPSE